MYKFVFIYLDIFIFISHYVSIDSHKVFEIHVIILQAGHHEFFHSSKQVQSRIAITDISCSLSVGPSSHGTKQQNLCSCWSPGFCSFFSPREDVNMQALKIISYVPTRGLGTFILKRYLRGLRVCKESHAYDNYLQHVFLSFVSLQFGQWCG